MLKPAIAGACALLLTTAPAAWAEIDAPTIWSDWQEVSSSFGASLSAASEDYSNGTLTLTDVSVETTMGDVTSTTSYGTIAMVERDDGTVSIELPEVIESTGTTVDEGVDVEQKMTITSDNLSTIVREEDGVRTYDISADAYTMTMTQEGVEDAPPTEVTMRLADLVSEYNSGLGDDGRGFDQTATATEFEMAIAVEAQGEDQEPVTITYVMKDITSEAEGSYGEMPEGPVETLSDINATYSGVIRHDGSVLTVAGANPQGDFSVDGTSENGLIEFSLGEDSIAYTLSSTGGNVVAAVPTFPVPINFSMEELTTAFTIPFGEIGSEKPFGMKLAYRDIEIDDALWALFDPTGQLPRDPATLVVDLTGSANLTADIFGDPEAVAAMEGPPMEVTELVIDELLLKLAGATLTGSGDLDFPNPSAEVPEPVGTVDLALDGGFALVDKLVALGFIPTEQAAFVKGMAGAVATKTGDDRLESTIEFTPGGGITANGTPLR
ncbi:hypothetical protein [Jannaschia rubra]|uniref:DUF2125 domain-containing protein n=1 Tax=Jannaschia rubra TaxID=282197 RepID=A0A0M6XN40_9RHOB|nr:hypothetical protein [Jannaschia rubra]CTQ32566.1 hypothetical protein JAN5088_01337 [Jannaschia rubra]SFF85074.1 hypothetical protein SAMN04488517_101500 [Jannaschia rubra]